MKRIRKPYLLVVVVLLIAWMLRPYPAINESKVHPALHHVTLDADFSMNFYMDGGTESISFTSVDVCIPHPAQERNLYKSRIYVGAPYFTDPKAVEVIGYEHTRWKLAKILSRKRWSDPQAAYAIAHLTGHASDWISAGISRFIH